MIHPTSNVRIEVLGDQVLPSHGQWQNYASHIGAQYPRAVDEAFPLYDEALRRVDRRAVFVRATVTLTVDLPVDLPVEEARCRLVDLAEASWAQVVS